MKTTTGCHVCELLAGFSQCNDCRRDRPNQQTLTRRELVRLMREEGLTADEAEARLGVKAARA